MRSLTSLVVALLLAAPSSAEEIQRLIQRLGDSRFVEREKAGKQLEAIGGPAYVPLLRAARGSTDPEVRLRARDLVDTLGSRLFGPVRQFEGHEQQASCVAISGDGKRILSGGLDATLRVWDGESGRELHCFQNQPGGVWAVAVSRDGKRGLSSAGMSQQGAEWIKGADFTIRLWDLEAGKELRRLEGHTSELRSVVFSPDDRRALSCGWDTVIRLWDLETGKQLRQLTGHSSSIRSVAFSRDGKQVISVSRDRTARVWNLETGKETCRFEGHGDDVTTAAFLPDGQRAVSAGTDKVIRLWNTATGKELQRFAGHTTVIWSVAVSPDGHCLLSAAGLLSRGDGYFRPAGEDHEVRVWDVETGLELYQLSGHTSAVMSVGFTADGLRAVSSSSDRTIRMWKVGLGGK